MSVLRITLFLLLFWRCWSLGQWSEKPHLESQEHVYNLRGWMISLLLNTRNNFEYLWKESCKPTRNKSSCDRNVRSRWSAGSRWVFRVKRWTPVFDVNQPWLVLVILTGHRSPGKRVSVTVYVMLACGHIWERLSYCLLTQEDPAWEWSAPFPGSGPWAV